MFESWDDEDDDCFSIKIHGLIKNTNEDIINPIIANNSDIVQAETNKHGILYRPDDFTGDNINDDITFNIEPEIKKNIPNRKNKFLPGERLLLTIQNERPEYINKSVYKSITTKRKSKLKNIINKSR
jgi:hypothetical protein